MEGSFRRKKFKCMEIVVSREKKILSIINFATIFNILNYVHGYV
jgi:DNA-binding transcriptional regulator YiaG